jgi:hypothetical protein
MNWDDALRMFEPEALVAYDADPYLADKQHRLAVRNGQLLAIDEDCDGETCWISQNCTCARWDFTRWVSEAERYREDMAKRWRAGDMGWDRRPLGPWAPGQSSPIHEWRAFKPIADKEGGV